MADAKQQAAIPVHMLILMCTRAMGSPCRHSHDTQLMTSIATHLCSLLCCKSRSLAVALIDDLLLPAGSCFQAFWVKPIWGLHHVCLRSKVGLARPIWLHYQQDQVLSWQHWNGSLFYGDCSMGKVQLSGSVLVFIPRPKGAFGQ